VREREREREREMQPRRQHKQRQSGRHWFRRSVAQTRQPVVSIALARRHRVATIRTATQNYIHKRTIVTIYKSYYHNSTTTYQAVVPECADWSLKPERRQRRSEPLPKRAKLLSIHSSACVTTQNKTKQVNTHQTCQPPTSRSPLSKNLTRM
jgi:hypothetical protein